MMVGTVTLGIGISGSGELSITWDFKPGICPLKTRHFHPDLWL